MMFGKPIKYVPARRPRNGRTATRWRGSEGDTFANIVDEIRYANYDETRRPLAWKNVLIELKKTYGVHADPDKLRADYHSAVAHRDQVSWNNASEVDRLALIELIEEDHWDEIKSLASDGGWRINWRHVVQILHSDDPRMTPSLLKARYESAVEYWNEVYSSRSRADAYDWRLPRIVLRPAAAE